MLLPQTKAGLIAWLEDHAPNSVITAVLPDARIELLGAFRPVTPSPRPGWILIVQSKHGKEYNIAVTIWNRRKLNAWIVDEIPWRDWIGGVNEIHQGDNPVEYRRLKHATVS